MALLLYSIDEAVDRKFIVTKTLNSHTKAGTLIHIMDTSENADGISVDYRITSTGQDFTIKFDNLKQFCKWARPDNLIARHYENLNTKDILHYIKVSNRSFVSFCLPVIIILLAVVWVISLAFIKGTTAVIAGAILSIAAIVAVIGIYRYQKSHVVLKLYSKVSSDNWGIVLK